MNLNNLDSSESISLVYLSILLIFLFSNFFLRKNVNLSLMVKQILSWIIIFIFGLLLYSFRYEFFSIKNRITAELFPSTISKIDEHKISINISNDGHFYIDLTINKEKVRFMVDTGASSIVLSAIDAKRVGINIKEISQFRRYQTANGFIFAGLTKVDKIRVIDGLVLQDVPVSISNSNMGVSLLGMSFLRQFQKYEFYQDQLILTY